MATSRDMCTEPEGGLTIDCDRCTLQGTDACDDCVVTFLLGRDPDDAVVIDADEARSSKKLTTQSSQDAVCCSAHRSQSMVSPPSGSV